MNPIIENKSDTRTKNSLRNITSGVLNKIITLFLPFVSRTIVLHLLGINYLGIGTLFSSVLSFLSLAEIGLGSAIVFTMYKPVSENDYETLNCILAYYKKIYFRIGLLILFIGTILVPLLPYLIKGEVPDDINIYILYYIYLINSVVSYFFFGYKQSILFAFQRVDIIHNITTLIKILLSIMQIVVLIKTKNYYLYALLPIIFTIFLNLLNAIEVKKRYPEIKADGRISEEIRMSVKERLPGLFGTKLNSIIVHSADNIVISIFIGLKMTGIYGNYYYIFNTICGFIILIFNSMTASIGNKIVEESIDDNLILFKNLQYLNGLIVCLCSSCLCCLYEPFMIVWVGDELCLGKCFSFLMTLYFFIYMIQRTIIVFKDAAGIWKEDQWRPYISMIINLVFNIILVRFINIYGIVISSIIAFFVSVPMCNYVLFKSLFKENHFSNLICLIKYMLFIIVICIITYLICSLIQIGIIGIICKLLICIVISTILFFTFTLNTKEFKYWKKFFKMKTNR